MGERWKVADGLGGGRSHRLPTTLWCAVIWVGLWGDLSLANVLAGLALGFALSLLLPLRPSSRRYRPSVPGHIWFTIVLGVALVRSTIDVASWVLRGPARMNPGIIRVDIGHWDAMVLAMGLNATTLTPGTLTLDIDPEAGFVRIHVLHLRDPAHVERDILRFLFLAERALRPRAEQPREDAGGHATIGSGR